MTEVRGKPYEVAAPSEVEPKVKASTVGAGAGAVTSAFLVWGIDELWYDGANPPDVPFPVAAMVALVVTSALTFASGFYAKHVNRVR